MPKKSSDSKKKTAKKPAPKKKSFAQILQDITARIEQAGLTPEDKEYLLDKVDVMRRDGKSASLESLQEIKRLFALPWNTRSELNVDKQKARQTIEESHYGMEDVKKRIIRHLSLEKVAPHNTKTTILCLVGPPGVGKTSIAKAIAEATGRAFAYESVAGASDEASIRGWARSYDSATHGKIFNALKNAGTRNPVILLDEIDKMGKSGSNGDPANVLLAAFDPAQNTTFQDKFFNVSFDLSEVMFILTANDINDIPEPLRNRVEVIELPGYAPKEKFEIATRYLIPEITRNSPLEEGFSIEPEALYHLIRHYTAEAGTRQLKIKLKQLASVAASKLEDNPASKLHITKQSLAEYLGPEEYRPQKAKEHDTVGSMSTLYWSPEGGGIIESKALLKPKKSKNTEGDLIISVNGTLGDSARGAIEGAHAYVRNNANRLGISPNKFRNFDLHWHEPTDSDGPSGGIASIVLIASCYTGIPIRKDVAITGSLTLSGEAKRIGGLKEKLIGAMEAGIKKVLIPQENYDTDYQKIDKSLIEGLEVVPISSAEEALKHTLVRMPKPRPYYINHAGQLLKFKNFGERNIVEAAEGNLQEAFAKANAAEFQEAQHFLKRTVEEFALSRKFNITGKEKEYKIAVKDTKNDAPISANAALRQLTPRNR